MIPAKIYPFDHAGHNFFIEQFLEKMYFSKDDEKLLTFSLVKNNYSLNEQFVIVFHEKTTDNLLDAVCLNSTGDHQVLNKVHPNFVDSILEKDTLGNFSVLDFKEFPSEALHNLLEVLRKKANIGIKTSY